MEGFKKRVRAVRIWLLAFNVAVVIFYGYVIFFTDWGLWRYPGFKIALGLALTNVCAYFLFGFMVERRTRLVLELTTLLNALYAVLIIDYFGGPRGFLFPAVYVMILMGFYYSADWGYVALSVGFTYVTVKIFQVFFTELQPLLSVALENSSILIGLAITGIGGYLLSRSVKSISKRNEKLETVADKLTAEKSQDEAVLTAIADGVYAVDMERNVVILNRAAQEMVNWEEKDALGIKCWNVMKLKDDQDLSVCEKSCPALTVWNTGEPVFRTDICFVNRSSKKKIQLSTSYAPIKDFDGNMSGAICVFRDVTQAKEVERLRNEFVSTASHELRTPITATEGYLSIITDSGLCKTDEKTKEFVAKAKSTLLGMSKLIQNLLSVTKIEEGKLEVNVTNFPIRDLVNEVIEVFAPKAEERGIALNLNEVKNPNFKEKKIVGRSLNVHADREMIKEVLNNLIENAIKFTIKGGVVISIDFDEEYATIQVADTGMGMPEDSLKHLFEKFYRVDNTATREVGGTGLGLYITRSIVEASGGRIWAESALGKGSRFYFTVPLALD